MAEKTVQTALLSFDELPDAIRSTLTGMPELPCSDGQFIYLLRGNTVIRCDDTPDGGAMMHAILSSDRPFLPGCGTRADFLLYLLTAPEPVVSPELFSRYRFSGQNTCRVVLFRTTVPLGKALFDLFSEMASVDTEDVPAEIDYQTVALMMDLKRHSDEDIREYALAVAGTLEGEGIPGIVAGIGRPVSPMHGLRRSYQDAANAIRLGLRYRHGDTVFQYEQLTLERLIDTIPEDQVRKIRQEYFRENNGFRLSDEMLETVRVFFKNDLNLTAASRQLFIHRNTLNYRLDKIKKTFGLDVRTFSDAAVFQILIELPES